MHECLDKCEYYKKVKNCCFCTYELAKKGDIETGYRGIASNKVSTKPPLWCPLRKNKQV